MLDEYGIVPLLPIGATTTRGRDRSTCETPPKGGASK
jgi:hypothetical protein